MNKEKSIRLQIKNKNHLYNRQEVMYLIRKLDAARRYADHYRNRYVGIMSSGYACSEAESIEYEIENILPWNKNV